jgi:hypothetical protein
MKKLFTFVAIAGLTLSTIGCAEKPAPAPVTPPADATAAPDAAAPAPATPPTEEKK